MRCLIHLGDKGWEGGVSNLLQRGIAYHGDDVLFIRERAHPLHLESADVVFLSGAARAKIIMDLALSQSRRVVYLDKPYFGRGGSSSATASYVRFSIDALHPIDYFQSVPRPTERWNRLGLSLQPRNFEGKEIIYAECTQPIADWYRLADRTAFATRAIEKIRALTDRPIVYRPKKSQTPPAPIPGTIFSHKEMKIQVALRTCYALVTFSTNAAVDAIVRGVPVFALGPSVARPVSNTSLDTITDPYFPSDAERLQWCADLAYCQWQHDEIEKGEAWLYLKETMARLKPPQTDQSSDRRYDTLTI